VAPGGGRAAPYALVLLTALFLFFETGAEVGFRSWIYSYAFTPGLASAAGAAYLNSAFWLAFTAGRLASIPLATRLGPRQLIPAAVGGAMVFAALAAALPRSPAALWLATIGLGLCMAPVWPGGFTLAGQSVGLSGRLSSVILLGSAFGGHAPAVGAGTGHRSSRRTLDDAADLCQPGAELCGIRGHDQAAALEVANRPGAARAAPGA
jgi:fucose permease